MLTLTFPRFSTSVSYHNHSCWSDGASSLEDLCRAARKSGLREFGVSDHWVIHSDPEVDASSWRMKPSRLDEYIRVLQNLKRELDDEAFTLKIGLEVDYFPENINEVLAHLNKYPLDYLIGSVHYAGTFSIDNDASDWNPLTDEQKNEVCEIYWRKLEGAAARKEFAFLGHLDLPKKYGFIQNEKYLDHADRVLDIAQKNGMSIELNTSGWFKACKEQYPCFSILKSAFARRIPVVISPDAHDAAHVKRRYAEAAAMLMQAGYQALPECKA